MKIENKSKLSKQVIKEIEKARKEVKEGKFYTELEARKELNL